MRSVCGSFSFKGSYIFVIYEKTYRISSWKEILRGDFVNIEEDGKNVGSAYRLNSNRKFWRLKISENIFFIKDDELKTIFSGPPEMTGQVFIEIPEIKAIPGQQTLGVA